MPPKRKNIISDADEKARKTKMAKKVEPRPARPGVESSSKLETEYKEPIKYDEYMEGGIPDSLLQGLGFSETETPQEVGTAEDEDNSPELDCSPALEPTRGFDPSVLSASGMSESMSTFVANQITTALAESGVISGLLPQQIVDLTMGSSTKNLTTHAPGSSTRKQSAPPTTPTRSSRRLSARNGSTSEMITTDASLSAGGAVATSRIYSTPATVVRLPMRTAASLPQQPQQTSRPVAMAASTAVKAMSRIAPRGYSAGPRTVTKGNIVYERMPTGEVIASLVKAPDGTTSRPPQPTTTVIESAASARGPPPPSFRAAQTSALAPINLDDCPINEYNVGEVLEKSIKATQSMRMLLTSLRDDLRRLGAGSAMVTQEQVRKRQEVADKLTKAYATYKRSIEDIESPQTQDSARSAAASVGAVTADRAASKSIRPVMLVKHGVALGPSGAIEQTGAWSAGARGTTKSYTKVSRDQGEVIELSESDDDATKEENKATVVRREGNAQQSMQTGSRNDSVYSKTAVVTDNNGNSSKSSRRVCDDVKTEKAASGSGADSKLSTCNGLGGSSGEKAKK